MSSTTPSPRQSSEEAASMKLFVKNVNGEVTTLDINPAADIATVKSMVSEQSQQPQSASSSSNTDSTVSSTPAPTAATSTTTAKDGANLRLVYAGRTLHSSENLRDLQIPAESTLHLARPASPTAIKSTPALPSPSRPASTSAKRKGPRCGAQQCNALAQRIVGDCGFCGGHFCGKHRLLESHNCTGLEDCRDQAKERNKDQLERERTVAVKGGV